MYILVDDLIEQVRSQLDESSTTDLTDGEILQALNRGQRKAVNIISRKYEQLFWKTSDTTLTSGTAFYSLPGDIYGARIELVEVIESDSPYEVIPLDGHMQSKFRGNVTAAVPEFYVQEKGGITLIPTPSGSNTLRIHYFQAPESLVISEGRISSYSSTSNYVIVDTLGDNISTSSSSFSCYVNLVNYLTGEIKASLQVGAINTTEKKVTFKASGLSRTSVLGKTLSTSLPSTISEDDYLCLVTGTCIPEVPQAYSDYLMQHAIVSIKRRLGEDTNMEFAELKDMEKELEGLWKSRGAIRKIKNIDRNFASSRTRWRRY